MSLTTMSTKGRSELNGNSLRPLSANPFFAAASPRGGWNSLGLQAASNHIIYMDSHPNLRMTVVGTNFHFKHWHRPTQ